MAHMVLRSINNPVPDLPGRWLAGEVVVSVSDTHEFGFLEMPINALGNQTVADVNAFNEADIPKYAGVQMIDGGTITSGDPDVEVNPSDIIVWQNGGYWTNFGSRNVVPNFFYHADITDKDVEQVQAYLEAYNKKLSYTSDIYNPETDRRRFTTTNERVSVSGNNAFTQEGIQNAVDAWNANYPENSVSIVDTDNLTYFQCETNDGNDGMPPELFDEWKENTQEFALADYYARRRWYFIQAGLDAMAQNDGYVSGPAAIVEQYLRDGLLD